MFRNPKVENHKSGLFDLKLFRLRLDRNELNAVFYPPFAF